MKRLLLLFALAIAGCKKEPPAPLPVESGTNIIRLAGNEMFGLGVRLGVKIFRCGGGEADVAMICTAWRDNRIDLIADWLRLHPPQSTNQLLIRATNSIVVGGWGITVTNSYEFATGGCNGALVYRVIMTPEEHAVVLRMVQRMVPDK